VVRSGTAELPAELARLLARAFLVQKRTEEAEALAGRLRDSAAPDSRAAQAGWRSLLAKALAAHDQADTAATLAAEAARLLRPTDLLILRADVFMDLAAVLDASGRPAEAARAVEQALALYEDKGNVVAARRAREAADLISARA
jgi:hypothetical protein